VVYWELIKKGFRREWQYRLSHVINNVASCLFGFVFMAIWIGVLSGKEHASAYSIQEMIHYMGFTQCILWVTAFLTPGLDIQTSVRTGVISLEMVRPASFYLAYLSQETGKIAYSSLFRTGMLALAFYLFAGFYVPEHAGHLLVALVSLSLAVWIALNCSYLIGISACWTYEVRWAHLTYTTLLFGLGGQLVPVEYMPGFLADLTPYLPFASIIYYPTVLYLEKVTTGWEEIFLLQSAWGLVLSLINRWLTERARRKLEIQGG
jgi:ABC-2 type transport system permease protein